MAETTPVKPRPAMTNEEILQKVRDRRRMAESWDGEYRVRGESDLRFSHGDHWDPVTRNARENPRQNESGGAPAPCHVIDFLGAMILEGVNNFRLAQPRIKVSASDANTDEETALVMQGIVRHIEQKVASSAVYDTGIDHAYRAGRGFWRIKLVYDHPESFDLVPEPCRIRDSFAVFVDPLHQNMDASDIDWGFITQLMSCDDFKATYPQAEFKDFSTFTGSEYKGWFKDDSVVIAEYFFIEKTKKRIALLQDGRVQEESTVKNTNLIIDRRDTFAQQVWQVKLNGVEVLEIEQWPGEFIPIIQVLGTEHAQDGRIDYKGMTRAARDPSYMIDYYSSLATEMIGQAPKTPYTGYEGQFKGHENQWNSINIQKWAFVEHAPVFLQDGTVAPPPRRETFDPAIQTLLQQQEVAKQNLRLVTGHQAPLESDQQSAVSGVAETQRQKHGELTNVHFSINGHQAIRFTGVQMVDLIRKLFTRARVVKIINVEGDEEEVTIGAKGTRDGQETFFQLDKGRYLTTIDTGPSFQTLREESSEQMVKILTAFPEFAKAFGDLAVGSMDFLESKEAAKRVRRLIIPPEALGDEKEPAPEQLESMVKQLQVQLKQINAFAEGQQEQVVALTTSMQKLTLQLADKSQDFVIEQGKLELGRDELAAKTQTDNRRLDIDAQTKARDLDIKQEEVDLKEEDMILERVQGG